jgi:hypothetical protein
MSGSEGAVEWEEEEEKKGKGRRCSIVVAIVGVVAAVVWAVLRRKVEE